MEISGIDENWPEEIGSPPIESFRNEETLYLPGQFLHGTLARVKDFHMLVLGLIYPHHTDPNLANFS